MTRPTDHEDVDIRTDAEDADDADVMVTPRATTPITPFGDAKPWAGSLLDGEADEPQPPDQDDLAHEA